MARRCVYVFCLFLVLAVCGCTPGVELRDRLIVQAVGVDLQNNKYALTLKVLETSGSGGEQKFEQVIMKGTGETVAEAFADIDIQQGMKIFLGNNKLIILGREVAEKGLQYAVDYFNNNRESRPTVVVVISDTTAADILTAKSNKRLIPAEAIEAKLDDERHSWPMAESELISLMEGMMLEGKDPHIPVLKVEEAGEGDQQISVYGSGVFRGDRMVDTLNLQETQVALWGTGRHQWAVVVVEDSKLGKLSLSVDSVKTRIQSQIVGGVPTFSLQTHISTALLETMNETSVVLAEEDVQRIEVLLAQQATQDLSAVFGKTIKQDSSDILGLGELLHKYEPDYWKANSTRWTDILPDIAVKIAVECDIKKVETPLKV